MSVASARPSGARLSDVAFLIGMCAVTVSPYLTRVGFYADDWTPIARWATTPDQSLRGLLGSVESADAATRPLFFALAALVFRVFGANPLPFHLVDAAVLASAGAYLYLVLAHLGVTRVVAVAIAATYLTLPHYATTRFWLSASALNLSLALFLGSAYAGVRALHADNFARRLWQVGWAVGLAASLLVYETVLPFALMAPFLATVVDRAADGEVRRWRLLWQRLAWSALIIGPLLTWKVTHTSRLTALPLSDRIEWFSWFVVQAWASNFIGFSWHLPSVAWRAIRTRPDLLVLVVVAVTGIGLFEYLRRLSDVGEESWPRVSRTAPLVGVGLATWLVALSLFFLTLGPAPGGSGIGNRLVHVAAIGSGVCAVGACGVLSSLVGTDRRRRLVFAALVGIHGAAGILVVNVLASYWIDAGREQARLVATIRRSFPERLPAGAFMLDGICPYQGPGIVFESSWDLRSALALEYGVWPPLANVVTPNLSVTSEGLRTSLYNGALTRMYPYGDLTLYDARTEAVVQLQDESAARAYFAARLVPSCPAGREGGGVPVLGLWP